METTSGAEQETGITMKPPEELVVDEVKLVQPGDKSLTVVASNPVEMAQAQESMIDRVKLRIEQSNTEAALAQENLEQTKKMKIKTAGWRRMVTKFEKEALYYEKILEALEEGYFVVPDMPVTLIAVRTDKSWPTDGNVHSCGMEVKDETPALLPSGAGEYVSPTPEVSRWQESRERKDGSEYQVSQVRAQALSAPDFPMKAVRPQILSELGKAQALKLFDAIGLIPADRASRKKDPMLIGIISTQKERMDYYAGGTQCLGPPKTGHRRMCFLLKWWLELDSI